MTTNHTPGPWSVEPDGHTIKAGGMTICDTRQNVFHPKDRHDARLIAAAPDLLAALDKILRAHESLNNGAVMGEATLCNAFTLEARAAIAKARGHATRE